MCGVKFQTAAVAFRSNKEEKKTSRARVHVDLRCIFGAILIYYSTEPFKNQIRATARRSIFTVHSPPSTPTYRYSSFCGVDVSIVYRVIVSLYPATVRTASVIYITTCPAPKRPCASPLQLFAM